MLLAGENDKAADRGGEGARLPGFVFLLGNSPIGGFPISLVSQFGMNCGTDVPLEPNGQDTRGESRTRSSPGVNLVPLGFGSNHSRRLSVPLPLGNVSLCSGGQKACIGIQTALPIENPCDLATIFHENCNF